MGARDVRPKEERKQIEDSHMVVRGHFGGVLSEG